MIAATRESDMTRAWAGCFVAVIACLSVTPGFAADASLQVPAEIAAGAKLSVGWKGPGAPADFISIDKPGTPDTSYGPYAYPKQGNPVVIEVPSTAGDYVVRYHLATGYAVIASAPLKVTDVTAALQPCRTVGVGRPVDNTGPKQPSDFISIDKPGSPDTTYGPYAYATQGSPAKIRAPDAPGDYVVRYHGGRLPRHWQCTGEGDRRVRDAVRSGTRSGQSFRSERSRQSRRFHQHRSDWQR